MYTWYAPICLSWAGFIIADPALDIATTLVLTTIPFKHLAPGMGLDVAKVDFDAGIELYLDAYRNVKSYDEANLAYYRVRRCVYSLIQGAEGQKVWQHPGIIQDLLDTIQAEAGIRIQLPRQEK